MIDRIWKKKGKGYYSLDASAILSIIIIQFGFALAFHL
jgi:hypothetical protein